VARPALYNVVFVKRPSLEDGGYFPAASSFNAILLVRIQMNFVDGDTADVVLDFTVGLEPNHNTAHKLTSRELYQTEKKDIKMEGHKV
jgi:hypothetical protein